MREFEATMECDPLAFGFDISYKGEENQTLQHSECGTPKSVGLPHLDEPQFVSFPYFFFTL